MFFEYRDISHYNYEHYSTQNRSSQNTFYTENIIALIVSSNCVQGNDLDIDACQIESPLNNQIRPEVLVPTYLFIDCNQIRKENGVWKMTIPLDFNQLTHGLDILNFQFDRLEIKFKGIENKIYAYLKKIVFYIKMAYL